MAGTNQMFMYMGMTMAYSGMVYSAFPLGSLLGGQLGSNELQSESMGLLNGRSAIALGVVSMGVFHLARRVTVTLDPNVFFPNERGPFEDEALSRLYGRVCYHWVLPTVVALLLDMGLLVGYVNAARV